MWFSQKSSQDSAGRPEQTSVVPRKSWFKRLFRIHHRKASHEEILDVPTRTIHAESELMAYDRVLPVQDGFMGCMAVLVLSSRDKKQIDMVLVVTRSFYSNDPRYFAELESLQLEDGRVIECLIAPEGIVRRLHQPRVKKVSVKQREALASSSRFFESLITRAYGMRATDVHISVHDDDLGLVRFRIDAQLWKDDDYPRTDLVEACAAAYTILASPVSRSDPTFNVSQAQSCAIVMSVDDQPLRLRYQHIPLDDNGFECILRLLPNKKIFSLQELGYTPSQIALITLANRNRIGGTFIAGVTGSGKTTTLRTLMTLNEGRQRIKQYSVEDPVEYKIPGVSQISIQRSANEDGTVDPYMAIGKVLMRADPEEIQIGEVRDPRTASIMKNMILSGHKIYSTVHAASAFGVIERITSEEIGIQRATLTSRLFLTMIMYQTLVPMLCGHCKLPAQGHLPPALLQVMRDRYAIDVSQVCTANPQGCDHCNGMGQHGMKVVAEVLVPDEQVLDLVREGRDIEAERHWRQTRHAPYTSEDMTGKTAFEHALYDMSRGVLDPLVIEETFQPLDTYPLLAQIAFH